MRFTEENWSAFFDEVTKIGEKCWHTKQGQIQCIEDNDTPKEAAAEYVYFHGTGERL